jgi:uncharacterized protein YeaO (DUF488 family)
MLLLFNPPSSAFIGGDPSLLPFSMHPIRMKRWNDPVDEADGTRILICRYRPRGVSKADETWSEWQPRLGPSKELHAAAYGKNGQSPLAWPSYRASYLREMRDQKEAIAKLAERVKAGEQITLMCSSSCERDARCHRSVLAELIMKQIEQPTS